MIRTSMRSRVVVGAIGIGMVVAACGGDDDGGEGSPTTSAAATDSTAVDGGVSTTVAGSMAGSTPDSSAASTDSTPPPTTAGAATTTAAAAAPPPNEAQLETASVALQKFVELPLLTAVVQHPDRSLWFTSQTGEVWKMVEGGQPEIVLDLTAETAPWAEGSERGMLGIGFNPVDGRLFLYFNDPASNSHVVSYALGADGKPDPNSR